MRKGYIFANKNRTVQNRGIVKFVLNYENDACEGACWCLQLWHLDIKNEKT